MKLREGTSSREEMQDFAKNTMPLIIPSQSIPTWKRPPKNSRKGTPPPQDMQVSTKVPNHCLYLHNQGQSLTRRHVIAFKISFVVFMNFWKVTWPSKRTCAKSSTTLTFWRTIWPPSWDLWVVSWWSMHNPQFLKIHHGYSRVNQGCHISQTPLKIYSDELEPFLQEHIHCIDGCLLFASCVNLSSFCWWYGRLGLSPLKELGWHLVKIQGLAFTSQGHFQIGLFHSQKPNFKILTSNKDPCPYLAFCLSKAIALTRPQGASQSLQSMVISLDHLPQFKYSLETPTHLLLSKQ